MKALLFIYFLASGITWVGGEVGQGISGRLALPEIVLLIIIGVVLLRPTRIRVSRLGRATLLMFVAFSIGVPGSGNIRGSLVEWLIHAFLVVGFIALYTLIVNMPLEQRLDVAHLWVRACGLLALVALYEFVGLLVGFPSLLVAVGQPPVITSGLVGTFRNTGQAGAYFSTGLAMAIALHHVSTGPRRTEVLLSMLAMGVSLAFTVKRSAIIGTVAGVVLLLLMDGTLQTRVRNVALALIGAAAVTPAVQWMLLNSPGYRNRISYKLGEGGAATFENFARNNSRAALAAFIDNPLFGAGLGGVLGVYDETFEVHSTYLGVPATTGVVGSLAYIAFMVAFFRACTRPRNDDPRTRAMGRLLLPLLIGLAISFAYTYHLRKREFWITAAIASAIMAPAAAAVRRSEEAYEPLAPYAEPAWLPPVPPAPAPRPPRHVPV